MTSKDALEILRECANGEKKVLFSTSIELANTIKQDLDRLEKINEVWHKNEPMESVDINGNHLQEAYDFIHRLCEENDKLKKAIEILKSNLFIDFKDIGDYYCIYFKHNKYDECDYTILCIEDKKQYELLKEVLGNDYT